MPSFMLLFVGQYPVATSNVTLLLFLLHFMLLCADATAFSAPTAD